MKIHESTSKVVDYFLGRMNDLYAEKQNMSQQKFIEEQRIFMIADKGLNAEISILPSGYPIYAFNIGLLAATYDLCASLAAEEFFFHEIKMPEDRYNISKASKKNFIDYSHLFSEGENNPDPLIPYALVTIPNRIGLSNSLLNVAVRFWFLHETAHYEKGHLGWLYKKVNEATYKEFNNSEAVSSQSLQAFEIDADNAALEYMYLEYILHETDFEKEKERNFGVIHDRYSYFKLITIGCIIPILLLELQDNVVLKKTTAGKTHPSPKTRIANLFRNLFRHLYMENVGEAIARVGGEMKNILKRENELFFSSDTYLKEDDKKFVVKLKEEIYFICKYLGLEVEDLNFVDEMVQFASFQAWKYDCNKSLRQHLLDVDLLKAGLYKVNIR